MAETRRESLIDAAAELLDRGGPAAVTLREVGRAAGVSHNAPYRHFADKDELLAAVAARELARQTPADLHGAEDAERMMHAYVRWALAYPERFRLTFGRWAREEPALMGVAHGARAQLIAAVERAQGAGRLPAGEPERLASLLLATAHGAADLALAGHLSKTGKGRADAGELVGDLFGYLRGSATP